MGRLPQILANPTIRTEIKYLCSLFSVSPKTLLLICCISLDKLQKIAKISLARTLHRDRPRQSTVVLSIALTVLLDISTVRLLPVFTRLPAFLLETGPRYRSVIVSFLCISLMPFLIFGGLLFCGFLFLNLFFSPVSLSAFSFSFCLSTTISLFLSLSLYLSISLSLYLSISLSLSSLCLFHSLYFSISLSFHLSIPLFFSLSLLSLLLPLVSSNSSCNLPIKSSLLLMNTDKLFYISKNIALCQNFMAQPKPPSWHTCGRSVHWL